MRGAESRKRVGDAAGQDGSHKLSDRSSAVLADWKGKLLAVNLALRRLAPAFALILVLAACTTGNDIPEPTLQPSPTPTEVAQPSPTPEPTPSTAAPTTSPIATVIATASPIVPTSATSSPLPPPASSPPPPDVPFSLERAFGAMGPRAGPHHPPDPNLAVGPEVIVVVTNHGIEIRDRRGGLLDQRIFAALFASVRQEGEGMADPRVVFDPWSERFFVHIHGGIFQPCSVGECVFHNFLAASRTPSPRSLSPADWRLYAFDAALDGSTVTDHQIDYVRLGVTEDAVVLVSVHPKAARPGEDTGSAFTKIRILGKQALLSGSATEWTDISRFPDPLTGVVDHVLMQPAIHYDPSEVFFLVSVTPGIDRCGVVVWGMKDLLGAAQLSHAIASPKHPPAEQCRRPPNAAQPDGVSPLFIELMPPISAPAIYRAGSLWVTYHFGMDFGGGPVSAIRFLEIDVSRWPQAVTFRQDVVLGEDGVSSFFPAIAVNGQGHVAIVFARSSANEYPSAYYSGRLASDPPSTLRPSAVLKAGNASQSVAEGCCGGYRWGDYSGAALDPIDDTAWIIGEYTQTTTLWGTWIGRIDWR